MQPVAEQRRRKLLSGLRSSGCRLQSRIVETTLPSAIGGYNKKPRPFLEEAAALAIQKGHNSLHAHRGRRNSNQRLGEKQRRRSLAANTRDIESNTPHQVQITAPNQRRRKVRPRLARAEISRLAVIVDVHCDHISHVVAEELI